MTPAAEPLVEPEVGMGTPDALYGAEKLHGLRLCSRLPFARVGIFDTIYGPLSEHEGQRVKFPTAVAVKALAARDSGRLELWGDGTQRRAFLYVEDAVEMILRVATAERYDGPVNIAAAGTLSCRDAAELCLDLLGVKADVVTDPTGPAGVPARECSTAKFARLYGSPPERSYADGFGELLWWLGTQGVPSCS
jgi:nucleoside-diphosphate-sugar epimerase